MYNDRRKDLRLPASLKVEVRKDKIEHITGLITEFSRNGLRAVFNDDFKFSPNSCVDLKIERPNKNAFITPNAEVRWIWKKIINGEWEVGFRFKDFIPQVKAEILEYAYNKWLKREYTKRQIL